jgi:hypothetical protein
LPAGSVTTGNSGRLLPSGFPSYRSAIAIVVCQLSSSGIDESFASRSDAGPDAATPAIVSAIHPQTTMRYAQEPSG